MKSIIVTRSGGPEVMALEDIPVPEPAASQVRIKVRAAGINYADIMQRLGFYPNGPKAPFGAGFEIAGDVEKVGANVSQWELGDAVVGFCAGGYSEYAVADAYALLKKPEQLDYIHAAGIPCQYLSLFARIHG